MPLLGKSYAARCCGRILTWWSPIASPVWRRWGRHICRKKLWSPAPACPVAFGRWGWCCARPHTGFQETRLSRRTRAKPRAVPSFDTMHERDRCRQARLGSAVWSWWPRGRLLSWRASGEAPRAWHVFGLARIRWSVLGQGLQDKDLAPLSALVQRRQKFLKSCGVHLKHLLHRYNFKHEMGVHHLSTKLRWHITMHIYVCTCATADTPTTVWPWIIFCIQLLPKIHNSLVRCMGRWK